MATTTEHKIDRTGWDAGPWDGEPDRVEWRDEATGLDCLIVRGPSGALCGYVAVVPGHPLHSVDSGAIDSDIGVHGGLTYSNACGGSICHVPREGEPDNVWWFGFDCAHSGDIRPRDAVFDRKYGFRPTHEHFARYRGVDYVRRECTRLARQLADAAKGGA